MSTTRAAFAAVVVAIYVVLVAPVMLLSSLPFVLLHECLALGIAIEVGELLFAFALKRRPHPRAAAIDRRSTRVAVLYVCCDDVDAESLAALRRFRHVDVFALDDSTTAEAREQIDRCGVTVVRRRDRAAFKAGNLNHWLHLHGERYDYFVVLDSDSLMTSEAVWELVAYAEAAENHDVAIVQSTIVPRAGNRFQSYLAIHAPARNRILLRLYDAIGWTLSHGHNNLHRMAAIRAVGGFETVATCEDTATSLRLLREGWRILLVETASFDAEPRDVIAYRRRYVRWARQTVDIIGAMKGPVPPAQCLLLARHLLAYSLPLLGVVSLALGVSGVATGMLPGSRLADVLSTTAAFAITASLLALVLLRAVLCGNARRFLLSMVLSTALIAFCSAHLALGMLRSLFTSRAGFRPTGAARPIAPTLLRLVRAMGAAWIAYVVIAALAPRPAGPLQMVWAACFVGSPLVLWLFHQERQ